MNICFPLKSLYCLSYKSNLLMDKPIIVKLTISAEVQNFHKYIYSFFHNQNSTEFASSIKRGPSKTQEYFSNQKVFPRHKKELMIFLGGAPINLSRKELVRSAEQSDDRLSSNGHLSFQNPCTGSYVDNCRHFWHLYQF